MLSSTFKGDMKSAPSPKHSNSLHYEISELNKPHQGDVLGQVTAVDLPMSKGALDTPMGTAIPNVGHKQ